MPDVEFFLSQRLCQDPLERFFGLQRQRGSVDENPNMVRICKLYVSLSQFATVHQDATVRWTPRVMVGTDDVQCDSADWIKCVNRGGLIFVNDLNL